MVADAAIVRAAERGRLVRFVAFDRHFGIYSGGSP